MAKKEYIKVLTPQFRLAFPALFEPHSFEEGKQGKYGITMLFDKDADLSAMKAAANKVVAAEWAPEDRPKNLRSPFRSGDEKPDYDGFPGNIFVKADSKDQPGMVNQKLRPVVDTSEIYAGCYCRATVMAMAYSYMGNNGVKFLLNNIQKVAEGEPFSGKTKAENDFEAVDTGEEITDFQEPEAKADAVESMDGGLF